MAIGGVGPSRAAGGFVGGVVVGILLAALVGFFVVSKEKSRVSRGWQLEYVVTTTRSIEAGTVLDMELIQQQSLPLQFVTQNVLRPGDVGSAVGSRVRYDLERGELLTWTMLGDEAVGEEASEEHETAAEGSNED